MEITAVKAPKYTFSGHETFPCRHFWLKKGYDFIRSGKSFAREDAVVDLGVGKNMVGSIRYWMKAFDLVTADEKLTDLAHKLFGPNGWDPYLEDEASLWLLHYQLIKKGLASSYHLIFNELRREKIEFTRSNFIAFLKRRAESIGHFQVNEKTVTDDFAVFVRMYLRSDLQTKDKEDTLAGLFTELELVQLAGRKGEDIFAITNEERKGLPAELVLYVLLDQSGSAASVSMTAVEQDLNNAGTAFAVNRTGLTNKIEILLKKYNDMTYTDHAGIREIQFKKRPAPLDVLSTYYAAN